MKHIYFDTVSYSPGSDFSGFGGGLLLYWFVDGSSWCLYKIATTVISENN